MVLVCISNNTGCGLKTKHAKISQRVDYIVYQISVEIVEKVRKKCFVALHSQNGMKIKKTVY